MFVAVVIFYFVDELFDALLFGPGADHQHVVRVDHDVFFQPADDGDFAFGQRDDRRARVVEITSLLRNGVGITVLTRMLVDRTPRPQVAPAEMAAADVYIVRLLHDAVVDRDRAAFGEDHLHDVLFGVGAQGVHQTAEKQVMVGQ